MTLGSRVDEGLVSRIRSNLDTVWERIGRAAEVSHRDPDRIKVVVVTKFQPIQVVESAILAGALHLGENYAEQAAPVIEELRGKGTIHWHMIGHVQTRKAKIVCQYFDFIHSLDSLKLAEKYEAACREINRTIPVFLEINLAGEATKSGWSVMPGPVNEAVIAEIEQITQFPHLKVQGLMTMPPLMDDPEMARPYFRRLSELKDTFQARFPDQDWRELSMGTSMDYQVAVQEGATIVRIGQAVLGPRPEKYTP